METKPWQKELYMLGKYGCYFLSIIYGCQQFAKSKLKKTIDLDILIFYELSLKNGWIESDCTILNPDAIAKKLLGKTCVTRHAALSETPKDNEIEITKYTRKENGINYTHFVYTRDDKVLFDPEGESQTVRKGSRHSKRIITVKGI